MSISKKYDFRDNFDGNGVKKIRIEVPGRCELSHSSWRLQVFCRPQGGLEPVGNVDFLVDFVNVGFDGVQADVEVAGDLVVGGARGDAKQNLLFPDGQRRRHIRGVVRIPFVIQNRLGHGFSRKPQLPGQDGLDPLDENRARAVLQKNTPDPPVQNLFFDLEVDLVGNVEQGQVPAIMGFGKPQAEFGPQGGNPLAQAVPQDQGPPVFLAVGHPRKIGVFAGFAGKTGLFGDILGQKVVLKHLGAEDPNPVLLGGDTQSHFELISLFQERHGAAYF